MLYNIIIAPIEMIVEQVFYFYYNKIGVFGVAGAILAVSIAINFLALPLYNVADRLQEKERRISKSLEAGIKRIRSTFKGDERFMMIQAFYRENHYHPMYAFRSSLSILIEIPFFIAAYHFLSHSQTLLGSSFLFLNDLGRPDELIKFSLAGMNVSVNILPIIMTLINFVSGAVYLKDAPFKEKVQLYALSLVFLVLLYASPSGLVFYWILNNLFSLAKNIVNAKVKNPARLVHAVISGVLLIAGSFLLLRALSGRSYSVTKALAAFAVAVMVAAFPFAARIIKRLPVFGGSPDIPGGMFSNPAANTNPAAIPVPDGSHQSARADGLLFFLSCIGLALFSGFLLPSEVLSTSPMEFSFLGKTDSPLSYIFYASSFYAGLFVFWPCVIYRLFGERTKRALDLVFPFLLFAAILNAYVFKSNYGNFSVFFRLDNEYLLKNYSVFFTLVPVIAAAAIIALLILCGRLGLKKYARAAASCLCLAALMLGIKDVLFIRKEFDAYALERNSGNDSREENYSSKIEPIYHLSKTQPNVVVLFLDRAISSFLPYIVKEFPEMEEQFSGFVYYPNTVSFSSHTSKGAPAMVGGYEYSPQKCNERPDMLIMEKFYESFLVMPRLFLDKGFDVTMRGIPYNYGDNPIEKCKDIRIEKQTYGHFYTDLQNDKADYCVKKNLVSFCLMEMLPPVVRFSFYSGGDYYRDDVPRLKSFHNDALNDFCDLYYFSNLTDDTGTKPNYIFIGNNHTHEYQLLENHTYKIVLDRKLDEKAALSGEYEWTYAPSSGHESDLAAYHVNASALLYTAKWLDYLKALGVYDNTRIIIVADHGRDIPTPAFKGMKYGLEYAMYNPLFMVKDFDATGKLCAKDDFMTNADTLSFATNGLGLSDVNPFTKNKFSDVENKDSVNIYPAVIADGFVEWNTSYIKDRKLWVLQDEKFHTPSYTVHDNIFDEANWTRIVK